MKVKGNVPVMHSCGTVVIEACVIMRADQRTVGRIKGIRRCDMSSRGAVMNKKYMAEAE